MLGQIFVDAQRHLSAIYFQSQVLIQLLTAFFSSFFLLFQEVILYVILVNQYACTLLFFYLQEIIHLVIAKVRQATLVDTVAIVLQFHLVADRTIADDQGQL